MPQILGLNAGGDGGARDGLAIANERRGGAQAHKRDVPRQRLFLFDGRDGFANKRHEPRADSRNQTVHFFFTVVVPTHGFHRAPGFTGAGSSAPRLESAAPAVALLRRASQPSSLPTVRPTSFATASAGSPFSTRAAATSSLPKA